MVWFIYAFFVLAAGGLYLLMPSTRGQTKIAGAIVGLGGLAGLLAIMGRWIVPDSYNWVFYPAAIVAIAAGARVVTHTKPVYSAVYFVLVVVAVSLIMIVQMAEFLAIALIIVYAGAILVTYVFVIMLAQQPREAGYDLRAREPLGAVLASFLLAAAVTSQIGGLQSNANPDSPRPVLASTGTMAATGDQIGNTEAVGEMLLTKYAVALELAGVLLLVAMVGSILLARRKAPPDPYAEPERPLGEIGRRVEPF